MYKKLLLAIAIFIAPAAQSQIPYIDSREVILKGVDFYKSGDYKKSIAQYQMVNECDTNYSLAIYEEILSLDADSSFEKAKQLAKYALLLPKSDKRDVMLTLAATYDYLQQQDSSIAVYDSMIRIYPDDHQPWYEKGVVYFKKKEYDKALVFLQHAALLNYDHFRTHYMLGTVYVIQGRLSEAMIAFETSLLLTQDADLAKKSISLLSSITEETDEVAKYYHAKDEKYSSSTFDELDQLVNSKLALSPDYKLQISLNDNIFRQSQVIMEKLKFNPDDTGFVMQFYVPLLCELYKKDMFESYMLVLFSGYGLQSVENLAKRKGRDITAAREVVFPYYNKILATRELNFNKRATAPELYHHYLSNDLFVISHTGIVDKETSFTGDAVLMRNNFSLRSKGRYSNDGKRDGIWYFYSPQGKLESKEFYVNGELRDSAVMYYDNGNIEKISTRDKEGNVTAEYEYNKTGWLANVRRKLTGDKVEERTYYSNGQENMTLKYNGKNLEDGLYSVYYSNGNLKKQFTLKNGKYDGSYKVFFEDGKVSETAMYDNGKLSGAYTAYYSNGALKEKYDNSNDKANGPYEEYYDDGKISEKGTYENGYATESVKYSKAGKEYAVMNYRGNSLTKLKQTNEDGQVISDLENKRGINEYDLYDAAGNKMVKMKINDKGKRDGLITFYYHDGAKSDCSSYADGNYDGPRVSYFKSGQVKDTLNYIAGQVDGYYKSYYENGILQVEGWYKKGDKQGLWKYYYGDGRMKREEYFLNDAINGYNKIYNVNGELTEKYIYDHGVNVANIFYDTAGKVVDSFAFSNGNAICRMGHWHNNRGDYEYEYTIKKGQTEGLSTAKYINGKVQDISYFKNGDKDSVSTEYFPDGTLQNKGVYKSGEQIGVWEFYNQAGELIYTATSPKNGGKADGREIFANGLKRIKYSYKEGEKEGPQNYYGDDGRVALQLYYEAGECTGYAFEGKDGKMLPEIKIKGGKATIAATYSNGNKAGELEIEQGRIKGAMKIYFSNGKLAQERNYKYSDLQGAFKTYNPDGKLVYEVNYKDDNEMGMENTYDKEGHLIIAASYYNGELNGPTVVNDPANNKTKVSYYHYGRLTSVAND